MVLQRQKDKAESSSKKTVDKMMRVYEINAQKQHLNKQLSEAKQLAEQEKQRRHEILLIDREKRWAAVESSKIKEKRKIDKIREDILNS